ncbi:MAG: energy-coupled thiamine transporter ThiT [Lactobacillus sp.]|jgi:thiamine transporter|nr:energy-coupled thiamine transporter ThiT [Lactobacillus sp.]MCI2032603.1 energy-coupled thiamine transporter ThiT [Lactobacillus sp.]
MQQSHQKLQVLLEVAIIAAFAMALEYVPHKTGISSVEMSYGLIPISVLALRRGAGPALAAGFTWGILDLLLIGIGEGSVLNVTQGFIEYPVAFTVAGLGGLLYQPFQKALQANKRLTSLALAWGAVALGVVAKYLCHFYAGWVFWGAYAPKGMAAWLYSLVINGLSAVFTGVLTLIVVTALVTIAKHLFMPKTTARLAHE